MSIPVLLIVEDEFLVHTVAAQIAEEAGFASCKRPMPTRRFRVSKADLTSEWCSRTLTCQVPWTAWNSPKLSDTAGRRSRLA